MSNLINRPYWPWTRIEYYSSCLPLRVVAPYEPTVSFVIVSFNLDNRALIDATRGALRG